MMSCRELIDFLIDYHSGELPPGQRAEFDRHLAICPPCVAYLKTYDATIRLGREAMQELQRHGEAAMPEALVQAILASRAAGKGVE